MDAWEHQLRWMNSREITQHLPGLISLVDSQVESIQLRAIRVFQTVAEAGFITTSFGRILSQHPELTLVLHRQNERAMTVKRVQFLRASADMIRLMSNTVLGCTGRTRLRPIVTDLLQSQDPQVFQSACSALSILGIGDQSPRTWHQQLSLWIEERNCVEIHCSLLAILVLHRARHPALCSSIRSLLASPSLMTRFYACKLVPELILEPSVDIKALEDIGMLAASGFKPAIFAILEIERLGRERQDRALVW
eukprot:Protomagalhaensia_sp_Gyna_25__1837@NODE_1973_length_1370_cov_66_250939_g729_i2_p1_GENE_NODE_1973_length_1370_cov_66_250939_g729_i2NODE_1973_length_1370_cov_66_250939_g729_i2_p1_ORF_typecomplete_len251_score47_83HEAT_2/PF13646_6/5_5e02HEAT_2/PF13646_6/0_0017HEAT_2/PF13646_6/36Arm/PF00514_23/2e02Arm/PF00514_23/0_95Arm/PF00514_23/1_1e03Arm_2/PF04826_13/8_5Arm_2/PF04826_13/12Adaptin_N/PF01602_20/0_18_NODE_1973_length_1370_cov_66_250939_g729_i24001152